MSRKHFHEHLKDLERKLKEMGQMVAQAVERSVEVLKKQDLEGALEVIEGDQKINDRRWEIEEMVLELIGTQQPVAVDLRKLVCISHIVTDLERMGDYAQGIAIITERIGKEPHIKPLIDIPRMCRKNVEMIHTSVKAFLEHDLSPLEGLYRGEEEIDALYDQVYTELIGFMVEDPKTITRATYLLWVAHNLERIADRVVNIAERVIFLVTGKMEEVHKAKEERKRRKKRESASDQEK